MDSNILVISPEYGYGGIGRHTRTVVGFLLNNSYKVTVHANKGTIARNTPVSGVQINEVASSIAGFSLFNPFFDLLSSLQLDKARPNFIIRTLPPFYPYVPKFGKTIPELTISHAVLPAFGTLKGQTMMDLKDKLTLSGIGKIVRDSEKKMLQNAKLSIAVCEYTKRAMTDYYGIDPSKILVVHNFVDTELFSRKKIEDIKSDIAHRVKIFKGSSRLAVFVAQLPAGGAKNFGLLFNLMVAVAASGIDVKFVIVGMGPNDPCALTYSRNLPENKVKFLGYVQNNLLPEIYSLSDFLLIPSLYENLPTVLLEAMACGVIPVSTSVGGIPEAIDDSRNGFLVSPNKEAFLDVLTRLSKSDSKTLYALSMSAQQKARENFDIRKVNKHYVQIAAEMMST
jgi:glycosyltransferase involved in cell wall biosynthesis